MRRYIVIIIGICFLMTLPLHASEKQLKANTTKKDPGNVPIAYIPKHNLDFDKTIDGTLIVHDFIIKNKGTAPLLIKKVKTSCGCTTVDYTKSVAPGAEGKITIKANTTGYGGAQFVKHIFVETNDPKLPKIQLHINGKVESFANLTPKNKIYLQGEAGANIKSSISIEPKQKYPFNIIDAYSESLEQKANFEIKKSENKFLLVVNNLLKTPGRYFGKIYLKTDNPAKDYIIINVFGRIYKKKG